MSLPLDNFTAAFAGSEAVPSLRSPLVAHCSHGVDTSHVETVKKERLNHALVESVAEVAITDGPPVSREDRMQWARKILAHLKDQKPQEASAASDDIVPLPKALMERVKKRVASAEQNWRNCRAIHTAWNKQGTTIEVSDGLPAEGRIGRRRHKELEDD